MKLSSGQITLLITALATTAVIVLSNRKPSSSPEPAEQVEQVITSEDVKIEKALEIINGGGQPMEGILMLKELADADEPNLDAVFLLGQLSVQSGQLEKAVERYSQVLELDPNNIEATWEFAMLNMRMGDLEDAITRFELCIEEDAAFANGYFFIGQCFEAMVRKGKENEEALLKAIDEESNLTNKNLLIKQLNDQQAQLSKHEQAALETYKTYLPLSPDSAVSMSVEAIINKLEVGATRANGVNP